MSKDVTVISIADDVAAATLSVDGVAALSGGAFDEVATLLPNRRVAGIRLFSDHVEIHIAVEWGHAVSEVGDAVSAAASVVAGVPAYVVVEDVLTPDEVRSLKEVQEDQDV